MLIEEYFRSLEEILASCPHVQSRSITADTRSAHSGFLRATLVFADESTLHIREFVSTRTDAQRIAYAYHYQGPDGSLIFRYDNTRHHRELPTFPHHKHTTTGVEAAEEPDLEALLDEVARRFR